MTKKSFILVSLKENKAKKLAEVISNKTCRIMLDYLAERKDATESEIAKELSIPISTVHYNMKALVDAKLVKSEEYHYSEKGKEVNHYRLANQYVIIAPETEKKAIREKLKAIIPTALIMGCAAAIIKLFKTSSIASAAPAMLKSAGMQAEYDAVEIAEEIAVQSAPLARNAAERAPEIIDAGQQAAGNAPEIALWFIIGAAAGVAVYLLIEYIIKKIKERD